MKLYTKLAASAGLAIMSPEQRAAAKEKHRDRRSERRKERRPETSD